jgi:hypothetical protein
MLFICNGLNCALKTVTGEAGVLCFLFSDTTPSTTTTTTTTTTHIYIYTYIHYTLMSFRQFCYLQKVLTNCTVQLYCTTVLYN